MVSDHAPCRKEAPRRAQPPPTRKPLMATRSVMSYQDRKQRCRIAFPRHSGCLMDAGASLAAIQPRHSIHLPVLRRIEAKTFVRRSLLHAHPPSLAQRYPRLPEGRPFEGNFEIDHFKGPEERLFELPVSTLGSEAQDETKLPTFVPMEPLMMLEDSSAVMWCNAASVKRRAEFLLMVQLISGRTSLTHIPGRHTQVHAYCTRRSGHVVAIKLCSAHTTEGM